MKILYVSQYFPPEMGAPAARADELSRHWAEAGHDVTILTGFPNHPTGVVPPEWKGRFRRLVGIEKLAGVRIVRSWLLPFPNRRVFERMLNYGSFCISSALTGLFIARPDVVIATSPQLLVGLSGWWLARWMRVPFIFEVRDLWPESLVAVGIGGKHSLLHRFLAGIAGFLYRQAERIVVVSPAFKTFLMDHWNVSADRIATVENGVETELFSPHVVASDGEVRAHLHTEGKFVVCYSGTIGLAHGLDTLVASARSLQNSRPDISFVLIGEGADKDRIMSLARAQNLTNLQFVGEQPRASIPAFIRASDVCVVLLKKTDLFQTVIPTKMLEFMSCGRPIILGVDGQAREVMERGGAGIFIEPENAEALSAAIVRLSRDSELRSSLGKNGRQYILRNFTRQKTANLYLDVLQKVLEERQVFPRA